MKTIVTVIICTCLISVVGWAQNASQEAQIYWPAWRGPDSTGVSPHGQPPIEWSENKNVRWKIAIPGKGHASPIVWGDLVFVATAIETDKQGKPSATEAEPPRNRRGPPGVQTSNIHQFALLAINRSDGSVLWQKMLREELPHEGTHPTGSWAPHSPVTDGEYVYAHFGSRGLYCLDMQGNLQWEKDLGDMTIKLSFGEGSSPVLHGDVIIVNWDHEGDSFITALDKKTGSERWRRPREEATSWATPLVVPHGGKSQVVINATHRTRSYDLTTGDLIWECGGMTANTIPSPVAAEGIVYVMSGFRGNALQAIRLASASGDITGSESIVWGHDRDTPYVPSPLLYGDTLYFLKSNNGVLSCFNAKTGEPHYGPQRLEGIAEVYASPVGANNRVYLVDRDGAGLVIKHGSELEVLAQNVLDDGFDASPAIVDNEIYLRGRQYLYCIATD